MMQQSMFVPEEWVLSVTQLNEYVRKTLAADPMLGRLKLRGEISNFKRHSSGHLYFSLKDEGARIACVMFRQHAMQLSISPREGMRVVLSGQVGLYAQSGQYQFYGESLRPDGVGELYQQFEALKQRLSALGWFDAASKKAIPLLPRIVGIVTSPTGAAVRDIIRIATARNPGVHLLLYPALVQGEEAAHSIAQGIHTLGALEEVDVIIVGRGGGSMEDLWAFNEEEVASAIYQCQTPIVSAVGHETDTTIADFVCDVRAATPSAAAMLAVPDTSELRAEVDQLRDRMTERLQGRIHSTEECLKQRYALLQAHAPARQCRLWMRQVDALYKRMHIAVAQDLRSREHQLSTLRKQLEALGPQNVLARGYAYVTQEKKLVPSAAMAKPGGAELRFADGLAQIEIVQIRTGEEADGGSKEENL